MPKPAVNSRPCLRSAARAPDFRLMTVPIRRRFSLAFFRLIADYP
tara:strand:+ start:4425 stop:4559 length:135 start_codon:yes stop_codon:yes gene_type:complete